MIAVFTPKASVNAFSTAFFSSNGFAQRSSGDDFRALIVVLRFSHPDRAVAEMYAETFESNSSAEILKPNRTRNQENRF